MAANWIKLRHDALDAPELRRAARATGLDQDQVLGKMCRLWCWADRHGVDGLVKAAELVDVDEQVGHVGFGAALVSVGWLSAQDEGVVIPNWERHFSDSAKARALGAVRAEKHRNARSVTQPPDPVTVKAHQIRLDNPPPPLVVATPEEAAGTLRAAWAAAARAGHVQPYRAKAMPDGFSTRITEAGWLEEALRAIEHLPKCRYFETPATLIQLCGKGFVTKVMAGQYDPKKPAKGGGHPPGGLEGRRTAEEAASEWTRGANDPERQRARQAYLDAKAAKAANRPPPPPPAEVPDEFDLERDRVALVAQLRKQGVA
jgi:hypothetical protein